MRELFYNQKYVPKIAAYFLLQFDYKLFANFGMWPHRIVRIYLRIYWVGDIPWETKKNCSDVFNYWSTATYSNVTEGIL